MSILAAIDCAAAGLTLATIYARNFRKPATPPVQALFIDCDDCLYQNNWATAQKITKSIAAYTAKLGVSKDQAYNLYKTYGTCIKGLLVEKRIDAAGAEDFLHEVHQISYEDIAPDPQLKAVLEAVTIPNMWVFTASTSEHARRCLDKIGLAELPWRGVIDCRSCKLETKHSRSSFEAAMSLAGVSLDEPGACVFCDDSVKNIKAAKEVGWRTVLVGKVDRDTGKEVVCSEADVHVAGLHELRAAMPELFWRPSKGQFGTRELV